MKEDTTSFADGKCVACGWTAYSQDDNGPACDRCGRRVVGILIHEQTLMSGDLGNLIGRH